MAYEASFEELKKIARMHHAHNKLLNFEAIKNDKYKLDFYNQTLVKKLK